MTILDEAGALVDGPREATYGHPSDDFGAVVMAAAALNLFNLNLENPPKEAKRYDRDELALHHSLYMILVKIQRLVQTPDHHDSVVDIAGYARCYEKVLQKMEPSLPEVSAPKGTLNKEVMKHLYKNAEGLWTDGNMIFRETY